MYKVKYENLTYELLYSIQSEVLVINYKSEDFYFKINLKEKSDSLVVHTNGALDYSRSKPPIFQRYTWADHINANCIFIDDKTLHNVIDDSFNTGWLIGTKERSYLKDYSVIIKKIQEFLKIKNNRVFYWGSSAGGTASISLSTLHKESTAIANNPQTNVLNDYPRRKNAIFRNVFNDMSESDIIANYYHRLSLVALMIYEDYVPRIFYIQNYSHSPDISMHMNPFIKELKESGLNYNHKLTMWLYNDEDKGHNPLSQEMTLEYLHSILSFKHL